MPVKISPLKILNDLGYEMVDIETDEDYLSALMEAIISLQKDGASGRVRADILQEELIRVRKARKEAAPSAGMKATKKKISTSKFFNKEEKQTTAADTTGTSSLAIRSKTGKIDTKKLIPEPTEEKGGVLAEILTGVNSIAETLKGQKEQDKKHKNWLQKLAERFKRRKKENKLEFKIFDGIKKTATKLLAPFKSAWQRMMEFIGKVLLGHVLFKIIEWMGDKDNQDKLKSILKFLKDWWPTMLAAYLLFGTGFTKMVAGIIKAVGWGIKQLAILIPQLIKAVAKLNWAKIGKGFTKILGMGGKGKFASGMLTKMAFAGGGLVEEIHYYNEGGQVPGSGNKDTVPAMLTPGEFVMSKGAVQQYGIDTMESMNAAAGGTNVPVLMPNKKRKGFAEGGDPTTPTAQDFGLREDFDFDNPEHKKEFVEVVSPYLRQFMEQQNAAVDENPDAFNGIKLKLDRDGKMPNFGEFVANQSEAAFNNSVGMVQSNELIPEEAKEALLKKMVFIRKETLDNPNFKGDMAFDINKDIPGTAANRLYLRAQADTTSAAAKAGISAVDRARQMNRRGYFGGGLVQGFWGGGRVKTQEEVQAYFDSQPKAQIQALIREKNAIERGPDGKIRGADRKKYNQLMKQIANKKSEFRKMSNANKTAPTITTSTPTQTPVKEEKKGGGFKRAVGGAADFVTGGMWDFDKRNRKGSPKDWGIRRMAGGLTDWATMGLTDFDKRGKGNLQFDPIGGGKDKAWGSADEQAKRGEKQSGMGIKRGIGGALDFMTLGMWDFDKQNPAGSPKDWGIRRMAGGLADFATMGLTDFDKRGAGIAQFNPIGGGKDKKWGVEPPQKKNVITAYEEEKNKMNNKPNLETDKEIPQFDVTLGRSSQKIKVLGISV